jgi:hypothetical protein
MPTKYRVIQVKGAKPETFIVIGINPPPCLVGAASTSVTAIITAAPGRFAVWKSGTVVRSCCPMESRNPVTTGPQVPGLENPFLGSRG